MLLPRIRPALAICCVLVFVVSCDKQPTSTDTAPKQSLKDTLTKIDKLAVKISEGLADGETEKAHDPLHQLVHLLEGVPKMIDNSSLGQDDQQTLRQSVDELAQSFGAIDKKMHGSDDGAEYSEVKEKIDAALATMNKVSASL